MFDERDFKDIYDARDAIQRWVQETALVQSWDVEREDNLQALILEVFRDWTGADGTLAAAWEASWGIRLTTTTYSDELELVRTMCFWRSLAYNFALVGETDMARVLVAGAKAAESQVEEERMGQLDALVFGYIGAQWDDAVSLAEDFSEFVRNVADPEKPEFWGAVLVGGLVLIIAVVIAMATAKSVA